MRRLLLFLFSAVLLFGMASTSIGQTLVTHDFDDGTLGPFESGNLNRMSFVNNRLQCDWKSSDYTGYGTDSKKTEFRADNNAYQFTQEFWTGFWVKVHGNTLENNPNTEMSLMQTWGFRDGAANHYLMLKYDGNGSLTWQHRYNMGSNFTTYTVYPNFPKDTFVRVVIRVKLSHYNQGIVQVWVDDVLRLSKTGQTIGFGDQDENGQINGCYSTPGSWGMYNYANGEYVDGETRTVTYDDVSLWNGANGYSIVDPLGSDLPSSFTPDPSKRYYIDSPYHSLRLAATGSSEDAYTTSTSTTGGDVEWQFVDKGNDYWHIQRAAGGSIPRLRTDDSENADMQEASSADADTYYGFTPGALSGTHFLTLADSSSIYKRLQVNSSSQVKMVTDSHAGTWESFTITEVDDPVVMIRKRNASSYALDGSGQSLDGQNVYLWGYSATNVNQQWEEIDRGNGYYSYQKVGTNYSLDGGNGGATNQNAYLWSTDAGNYNQHWQKVDMGDGYIQLRKRNSSGYGINGGSGGVNGQNVNLYDSSNPSQNLQWMIEYQ